MQLYWNRTSTWVFSLNLLHIFRTLFLRTPLNGCFWNKYKQKMQDLEKLHITVNAIRSIVADIVLQQLEQFECLMFGGFHIAKAFYIILANFKKKMFVWCPHSNRHIQRKNGWRRRRWQSLCKIISWNVDTIGGFAEINPFVSNAPFLYPLKTSVFWCFQRVEKGCIGNEWVHFENERECILGKKTGVDIFKSFVTKFKDFQNAIKQMKKKDNLKMNFDKSCKSIGELKIDFLNS